LHNSLFYLIFVCFLTAMLKGWRLKFVGSGGMASAEECEATNPEEELHGVLHLMTRVQMQELDKIEGGYARTQCVAHLYDGTRIQANVYQMEAKLVGTPRPSLPTERYIDIICQGCQQHGVSSAWIDRVRAQACVTRPPTHTWRAFPTSDDTPLLKHADLKHCSGRDGNPLRIVINGKALEFCGDTDNYFYTYFVKNNIGGTDFTLRFARGYYEPAFKFDANIKSVSEMEESHRLWVEDQFVNPPTAFSASRWTLVGLVDPVEFAASSAAPISQ
jgi:hypothetical protein